MKIVIPMSGSGNRFLRAGYKTIKPLIRVNGKPIIEYVVNLFPGEDNFIFICNKNHLENTELKDILNAIKPNAVIVPIELHDKGPVFAVSRIFDKINDEEPILISYCDFFMDWDYEKFKTDIQNGEYDGAIPCYIGFHPHLLRANVYAGVLADKNNLMLDIKEKHCFTKSLFDCYHSVGAYYFKNGYDVKKYFQELMDLDINLNDEYYISMVYYLYKRDNKKVLIPEIKHFMQWGTPEDLEEFEAWLRLFAEKNGKEKGVTDIPKRRENFVKIPYAPDSQEYLKSHSYWREYLNNYFYNYD